MKVVIVGGVAGGASTAARLRRMDENCEIIMFERDPYISFANCGLPYHIGGVIEDRNRLLVMTPEKLQGMFKIDSRVNSEVVKIDREGKKVVVNHQGNIYEESYDKLVLSPGAAPIVPPIPGVNLEGVFTLRNIPDMDKIKGYVEQRKPNHAVVIGGGFIGVEIAENLIHRGMQVTLVEKMDQVMAPLDFDMAAIVHQQLQFSGVRLALGNGFTAIERDDSGQMDVVLESGDKIFTDMVVMAIGVRPENELAKEAGLELGPRGAIAVNSAMQTSDPDIYALGDAVQVHNIVCDTDVMLPLAGPASKQGRIAADHITGRKVAFSGVQGTSVVKVFDLTVSATGLNARQLEALGFDYDQVVVHENTHAGYYPGATQMALKLLFGADGTIFGAQTVGGDGAEKRIDVIATAIRAKMKVYDLEELELAYAPPFGSSRDPVNIVGYAAGNILRGDTKVLDWEDVGQLDRNEWFILDVRDEIETTVGQIDGSVNIPLEQVRDRIDELPRDKKILLYCAAGKRAYFIGRALSQLGFDVYNLSGGWKTYACVMRPQSNFNSELTPDDACCGTCVPLKASVPMMNMISEPVVTQEIQVDACGLQCPGPILQLFKTMNEANDGDVIRIQATDMGFASDVEAWCNRTGNQLLSRTMEGGVITALVQKGLNHQSGVVSSTVSETIATAPISSGKTMVVFSGDLDKALAAFIIANGAAAMGHPVTLFFTFWGLNILRKPQPQKVVKNLIEKMFGMMMPRGANKLTLSQMHMAGIGTGMIKGIMKKHNVASLPELIRTAQENGVRLQACQMSMDLMGIKKEELLDGVETVGVATIIGASDHSNATLFI